VSDWFEIIVPASAGSPDEIGALLADRVEAAQPGTEIRAESVVFWVLAEDAEAALADTRRVARELAAAGFAVDAEAGRPQPALPEEEWRDAWKKYFHVIRLTRRLVIVPSWETYSEPQPEDLIVHLDPGQAFGTGAHSSTRMVLEELQEASDDGLEVATFLDVGTGSGILSITAAKLWPEARGEAIDTDPIAVIAAVENCQKNDVGKRVRCSERPLAEIAGQFDVVSANIQANVLEELCDELCARLAPGGRLLLSGLLSDQVEDVAALYAERPGLAIEAIRSPDDDSDFRCARLSRFAEEP